VGEGCWWTKAQAAYIKAVVVQEQIAPQFDKMARKFNRNAGGGPLKISMTVTKPSVPSVPDEVDDMAASATFECCGETIRHDGQNTSLYCPICGIATVL